MKYFYIIERNGTITELTYREDTYKAVFEEWIKGGRLIVTPKGRDIPQGINAVDISKIATEEDYKAYIDAKQPKAYIRDGTWYDSKQRGVLRHERWKQLQIDEHKKKLEPPKEKPITPAMQKRIDAHRKNITNILSKNNAD